MKIKKYWFFPEGIYSGQMRGGVAHGKGTYTSSFKGKKGNNKYFYKGDWVNGQRHGKAKPNIPPISPPITGAKIIAKTIIIKSSIY